MAVRLRKAFRYPEELDEREELDEEEQERVIEQLQNQNDTRNAQYTVYISSPIQSSCTAKFSQIFFTFIPLLAAVSFVPSVVSAFSLTERLFSFLSLSSLVTTAYIMKYSPLQPDRKGKRPMTVYHERIARLHAALVPVTGVISLLLGLVYLSAGSSYGIQPVLYLLPGGTFSSFGIVCNFFESKRLTHCPAMFVTILLAQRVMRSVDLASLKDLQYEYKGA